MVKTIVVVGSLDTKGHEFAYVKQMIEQLKELETNDSEIFNGIRSAAFYSLKEIKFQAPISNPQKIICLGRNFLDHAKEGGAAVPKNPMIWGKFNSAIIGHQDNIIQYIVS